MKFYIQITEEHPNENGEYAPIREGSLKLFLDSDTKILFISKPLNNVDKNTPIEFEVDDKLYITNFIARLENSDNYGREPVLDKNLRTQPKLYENPSKPQRLRFRKLNQASANIGIIKAYKKDSITKNFLADSTALSNPKNEIYTMDLSQEINLKAFVYERQKTYLASKDITDTTTQIAYSNSLQKGNITKNITSITPLESANIKWAFKIVNGSYKADSNARDEAFPALGEKKPLSIANKTDDKNNKSNIPTNTTKDNINKLDSIPDNKSYVVLEHLQGDSIFLKLSDIFSDTALESLIDKNIIFFAYDVNVGIKTDADKNINAYHAYQDNNNANARIISQDKITSIELKILQTRFRLEFDGEYLGFLENEREIKSFPCKRLHGDKKQSISLSIDLLPQILKNHHIDLLDKESELIALLQAYNIQEIPLKVKYQKRVLIIIERFKQTTESTTARMNIYVDRKRVDSSGKITDKDLNLEALPKDNPYAFILERPSPDSIGGGLKLRIPEGRYSVKWHSGIARKENLKLHNEFVGFQRAILIHEGYTMENTKGQAQGTSPRNTFGCLVIAKDMVKKNGNSNDFIDNVLQPDSTKKQELANAIKPNGFLNSYLAKLLNKKQVSIKEVVNNIEIRVRNSFESNQANAKQSVAKHKR